MDIKDQVTNLEISKKLRELGAKQSSSFYWVNVFENFEGNDECWQIHYIGWFNIQKECYHTISAFTVAELVELLSYVINNEANTKGKLLIYLLENKLI